MLINADKMEHSLGNSHKSVDELMKEYKEKLSEDDVVPSVSAGCR